MATLWSDIGLLSSLESYSPGITSYTVRFPLPDITVTITKYNSTLRMRQTHSSTMKTIGTISMSGPKMNGEMADTGGLMNIRIVLTSSVKTPRDAANATIAKYMAEKPKPKSNNKINQLIFWPQYIEIK